MQKLSMIQASTIIVCRFKKKFTSSYKTVVVVVLSTCKQVTTCTDKHGSTVSMKDAPDSMCVVPNSARY